jgi:hypothetical protein
MTAMSDEREPWQCPACLGRYHVIAGQDHAANHAPFCPGKPTADQLVDLAVPAVPAGRRSR